MLQGILAGQPPRQWQHYPEDDAIDEAYDAGGFDFLIKPVNLKQMELSLRRVMRQRTLMVENLLLKEEVQGKTDYDLFPKKLADKYRADDHEVERRGGIFEVTEEHKPPGQAKFRVRVIR